MNTNKNLAVLTLVTLGSAVACGSDILRYSGDDNSGTGGMGGTDGDGDGDGNVGSGGIPNRGTGAASGGGSTGGGPSPTAGAGGFGGGGTPPGEGTVVVEGSSEIRDLKANEDGLFWVEYGTFDEFENYGRDGQLLYLQEAGGTPVVLLDGLHGPIRLGVTDDEIYYEVDQSIYASVEARRELWRYDRSEKTTEYVAESQSWALDSFWTDGNDTVFIGSTPPGSQWSLWLLDDATPPVPLYEGAVLASGSVHEGAVYFNALRSVPLDGGSGTRLDDYIEGQGTVVFEDYIYTVESQQYLSRSPTSGDVPWERVADFDRKNGYYAELQAVGGRYFAAIARNTNLFQIYTGTFDAPNSFETVFATRESQREWCATATAVYLLDEDNRIRVAGVED